MTTESGDAEPDVATLRLIYADVIHERDRLRDARRAVTARLGPLPASAGLIIGLFAGLRQIEGGRAEGLVWAAFGVLCLLTLISIAASRLRPYRSEREKGWPEEGLAPEDLRPEQDWLIEMIVRERRVYHGRLKKNFELERFGLDIVQFLLVVEVLLLLILRVVA
jgi:hypothetical protein